MRRVALALLLPLVVGAPVVLIAGPAHAATMTITTVSAAPTSVVYGQEVIASASVTDGEIPVGAAGTIQFFVRHSPGQAEFSPSGAPVPLTSAGTAVSAPLVQDDGKPLDLTEGVSDFWQVYAEFNPADPMTFEPSNGIAGNAVDVSQANSSVDVEPTATTLVADLAGNPPGGGQPNSIKPSGVVTFKVNGVVVGSNDVVDGRATIGYALPSGSQSVTATYAGDSRYAASSASMVRTDPTLEARVLATFPPSRSGWYHTAVEVYFLCRPHGSELVEDCPDAVMLKKSGKGQSVSRSVHAVDGGSATVTVTGIDIDRDKPVISVVNGRCKATDKLSGVKSCKLKVADNGRYRAIAVDRAGNRAVKRGTLG